MSSRKRQQEKARLHPRNKNRERYDLATLSTTTPGLKRYVKPNKYGKESIDFANPRAVKLLNKAILNHYYGIKHWKFPDENLCPPVPGRADYLHHMADLLGQNNSGSIPMGDHITCLDVGVGASCIYPIIGVTEYGWRFIGSDSDPKSIASARNIVHSNPSLKGMVDCRLQKKPKDILHGIISKDDKIDLTICNPPFHASMEDAQKGTQRKVKNLSGKKMKSPKLNFAGISNELIYEGGEYEFIRNMIRDSKRYAKNCYWFSSLVSKQSNLKKIRRLLENAKVNQIKTIATGTGNKMSRIVVWTFLSDKEQKEWMEKRWE